MLTSNTLVLLTIANDPHVRIRDIAAAVGLTERASIEVVRRLETAGMISISHEHRRNAYAVNRDVSLTIPLLGEMRVGELLSLMTR